MTDGRDQDGGFRWNLTPGASEPGATEPDATELDATEPDATVEPTEQAGAPTDQAAAPEPPPAPVDGWDVPTAASPIIAPVDEWDVPTAAAPIIGRSVFPLGPPALLPPPYIPPPAALEAQLPPLPTLPPPLDSSLEGVTEVLGAHPVGLPDPVNEGLETTDIDVVFGDSKFVDYDAPAVAAAPPPLVAPPPYVPLPYTPPMFPPAATLPETTVTSGPVTSAWSKAFETPPPASAMAVYEGPRPAGAHGMPRSQKILIAIAGTLVGVLALVALFLLGMRIGERSPATEAAVTPTAKPSTTATASPGALVGPVAPGDHSWDELLGGECLSSYESPWQDTYTVVECTEPHTAQLLAKAAIADAIGVAYPTTVELQSKATLECSATTVINYEAAGAYDDLLLESSFPASAEKWDAGDRTYYCFATRSGGGELSGSLAAPAA